MFFLLMTAMTICLEAPSNKIPLEVKVPENFFERRIGLSRTKKLGESEGMLFVFHFDGYHSFTMKKTSIPLAFFFFDADKNLIEVRLAKAHSKESIVPKKKCRYVLEAHPSLIHENTFPVNTTKLHFSKKKLDD